MCCDSGKNGIFIDDQFDNVCALMYADDMSQISDSIGHLQKLLDTLDTFSMKWGLSVNLSKTNIMVFRNGGTLKKCEKWTFQGTVVKPTTYYKYLGLVMSSRLSWSMAQKTLAAQASKVVGFILSVAQKVQVLPLDMHWHLFDKMVLPILLYGSEIWGSNVHKNIERVQYRYCKYIL